MTRTISPAELKSLCDAGPLTLIDVRTPAEFESVHVVPARNIPLDRLDPAALAADRSQPVYVICKSGGRGKVASEQLTAAGYADVTNIDGGTTACEAAGLPVVRGRSVMSLERQVRIVAGGIALVGAVLALVFSYWFALIPAAIGAGLLFAGLTDTCGMGLLLARMPWNQRPANCPK